MLDEKDLQAIQSLIERSEARMIGRMEERIGESEARMMERMDRLDEKIEDTRSQIMAYIESDVMPRFGALADGHQMLWEKLAPKSRVEKVEEEVAFLKPLVMSMLTDIDKLKKAQ